MESFRTIFAVADRMGFTQNGGQVTSLPYAEGVMLVTIIDDWKRIRVEPQVLTLASRVTIAAPGAGLFNVISFKANKFPARIIYMDDQGSGAATNFARLDADVSAGLDALLAINVLEGPGPILTTPFGVPPGQGGLFQHGAQTPNPVGSGTFNLSAAPPSPSQGTFLPLLVLPGEKIVFSTATSNVLMQFQIVWQQLATQEDVVTSQAVQVLGNL